MLSPVNPLNEPLTWGWSWGPLTQTPSSTPEGLSLVNVGAWGRGSPCSLTCGPGAALRGMVFVYAPESTKSSPRHMHGDRFITFLLS